LWNLDINRNTTNPGQCHFPGSQLENYPNAPVAFDVSTGSRQPFQGLKDTSLCADCSLIVVRNGWITDLETSDGRLRRIAISGGTVFQLNHAGKEIPLSVASVYQPGDGKLKGQLAGNADLGSGRVRGLITEKNRVVKALVSEVELPFAPERTPRIFLFNADKAGGTSVTSGEKVRVLGTSFLPYSRTAGAVRILFDGKLAAENIKVRPDGSFSIDLAERHLPGELSVTAEQRDGLRLTMTRSSIDVMPHDGEK
jgi:hypothetical protein